MYLDYKMYDIPETVRRGVVSAAGCGVRIVTVHGDPEIVAAAAAVAARRAATAASAGAHGLIASAADDPAELRRQAGKPLLVCTPGIRMPGGAVHDQTRVATPETAIARGADYLVVGRPIVQAADPAAAARSVLNSIKQRAVTRSERASRAFQAG